ncbi:MAG: substrate-binding domain-containing protein [Thermoplasmata archaeon]
MTPRRWWGALVTVALVCLAGGFAAGTAWIGRTAGGGGAPPGSPILSITAAGTLGTLFPRVGDALANASPGVDAPLSAQQYQGSLAALAQITVAHATYDVAAAADYRLIPQLLEPTYASYEVIFATTPEVLAYDPSIPAFAGINTTNWPSKLVVSGAPLAIANASTDPNGFNEIFVLELEGLETNGSLASLYDHYFTTPVGSFAQPDPSTTRVEPETQAAALLATHQIAAFIIYRSYAVAHGLAFVPLDPLVGLGGLDPASIAAYAKATTTIDTPLGPELVRGAPVAFGATVPANAPNPSLGVDFLDLLLSPEGASLLVGAGFDPVTPGWTDAPGHVPAILAPDVIPLPSDLPVP